MQSKRPPFSLRIVKKKTAYKEFLKFEYQKQSIMSNSKVGFGNIFWPSFLAALIVSIIGIIIFVVATFGIIGSFASMGESSSSVNPGANSVLHMKLDGQIAERTSTKFNPSTFSLDNKIGLADILEGLKLAAKDPKIKGLYIEIDGLSCNYATAREIRRGIDAFEKSGKFTIAYNSGEVITQKEYYVSSAANTVYGFPSSNLEIMGLAGEMSYFKGTLDKLDLEVQIIRGRDNDFKSAVEPFFLSKMSDSSRLQLQTYINSIWSVYKGDVAASRNIQASELDRIADGMLVTDATDGVKYKLLDATKYRDEVMSELKGKLGLKSDAKIAMVDFEKFASKNVKRDQIAKGTKGNIAVILAEGDISVDGDGLTSKDICKQVKAARENKNIKIVVLRVNSPGGSALASDEIWREVKLTNKTKKVIVSMGDVAASGGYYISAPAYKIFAEPSTITGSIGVFGMIPYTGKMFENKLGVSFDRISTNKHEALSTNRKLTPEELEIIQGEVNEIYDDFLLRVAEGRNMTKEEVNKIARGRVWAGKDAVKIGLVDELGGLEDAIRYAAKTAGISSDKMSVLYYPLRKNDKWEAIAEAIAESEEKAVVKTQKMPNVFMQSYEQWLHIEGMMGIQMRLPFELTVR